MTEREYKKLLKEELIKYRLLLDLPDKVTFGVEIEYENIAKDKVTDLLEEAKSGSKLLEGWKNESETGIAEYDKLGREMNGEIISPILTNEVSTWKSLKYILDILKNNGALITTKCGGHVNIGSHILENNSEYWRNFLLLWILYEREIYKFSSGEYLKLRKDVYNIFERVMPYLKMGYILDINTSVYLQSQGKELFDKAHDICLKKFNHNKIYEGNRIEFRIPNGTLSEEIWQNNINFFINFMLTCRKELDVEKILYKIKNKKYNPVELAEFVFSSDIDRENFLIQTLKTNKLYRKELPKHIIY